MYNPEDTIIAISSPSSDRRVMVRVSGPGCFSVMRRFFWPMPEIKQQVASGKLTIAEGLELEASAYLFVSPRSYTGDDVVEFHFNSSSALTGAFLESVLNDKTLQVRMAEAGEFTARAYFNGKLDLAQAEAVNEIITSSNFAQLRAAEQLLSGKVATAVEEISENIMELLGFLEAGLDFSPEDLEFLSLEEKLERAAAIQRQLNELVSGGLALERIADLPSAAIAGCPNAGKSSLLNKLLGSQRSIVSGIANTTRDVLSGSLELPGSSVVLFDCAGLNERPGNILEELAQQSAIEAIGQCSVVIFAADMSKDNWSADSAILEMIAPQLENKEVIWIATKADMVSDDLQLGRIKQQLGVSDIFPVSSVTGAGLDKLRDKLDKAVGKSGGRESGHGLLALNTRHRQTVAEAIENTRDAAEQISAANDEIAAVMLRRAYQLLGDISRQDIDQRIIETIFGHFCIGK